MGDFEVRKCFGVDCLVRGYRYFRIFRKFWNILVYWNVFFVVKLEGREKFI